MTTPPPSVSTKSLSEPLSVDATPPTAMQDWRSLWTLDPAITFLNHGSFGACPRAVLEYQRSLRGQLEAEPLRFFAVEFESLLDAARQTLAQFVGANPADLVFLPNATTGVNTVLRSLTFQSGDELLTTNQEYNASRNALNFVADRAGVQVVVAPVPFPLQSAHQVIEAVLERVTSRTRLVLLDHVVSQTALIFPLQPLIQQLNQLGIDTLIDGAHAPGMIPLHLNQLAATYYTGNCHKWLCSPKGAAFLYVRPDRQAQIRPLVISHGANSPRRDRSFFHLEFDWMGTADPTPYLCVPQSIAYLESLRPGGWPALMEHNRTLALAARDRLCHALKVPPPCPAEMVGAMATLPLPDGNAEALQTALFHQFYIEVPIIPWPAPPQRFVRVSAQLYNTLADYERLAVALEQLLPVT